MDQLMRWFAPQSAFGFAARLLFFVAVVALANILFTLIADDYYGRSITYSFAHAAFVGGPLIAFFLTVCSFQIRLQRKLWRLSRRDPLTGLNNRRTFFDQFERIRQKKHKGVLLMVDADLFKVINDTYGHQAGDECLKSIAYVLKRNVRQGDIIGRIGGEEFAIYLQDTTPQQARVIGERLTKPITFQSEHADHLSVTLSIGAVISEPDKSIDQLFALADSALYRAKLEGRARIIFWDKSLEVLPHLMNA